MSQKRLTKSVRDELVKTRDDYFTATKLVALKIESNSWRAQLEKLFSKSVTEDIAQFCKLQEGDAVLLTIGHHVDAVSQNFPHDSFHSLHLTEVIAAHFS